MEKPDLSKTPNPPEKPPAYVIFKERQKDRSLLRPFFLAGLMLVAVVLLAPLVRLIQPKKTTVGLVDEVEPMEFQPPPVLPDSVNLPEPETVPLPELEPELQPEVQMESLAEDSEAVLRELDFLRNSVGMASLVLQDSRRVYPVNAVDIQVQLANREALSSILDAFSAAGSEPVELEVGSDGRARIAPGYEEMNPEAAAVLDQFLDQAEFRPAVKDGLPVRSRYRLSSGL